VAATTHSDFAATREKPQPRPPQQVGGVSLSGFFWFFLLLLFFKHFKMAAMMQKNQPKNGVDVWMIRDNLKLSYEERVEQHQKTIDCISALNQIGQAHRERSQKSARISHQKPT
jgi:hypothetical protein